MRLRWTAMLILACAAMATAPSQAPAATAHGQEPTADSDAPPPPADDAYRFSGGQEIPVPLKEDAGGVAGTWPGTAGKDWDTALLGVRFEPPSEGDAFVADTFVEIEADGHSIRQDLES